MRIAVAAAAVCLSIVGISVAADVQAAIKRPTNIPAQRLDRALQALATDRGLAMAYRSEVVGERQTEGASGDLTPDEALTQLLKGTGLTYRFLDEKTVTVVPTPTGPYDQSPREERDNEKASAPLWDRLRVAQVDQGANSQLSTVGSNASTTQDISNKVGLEEVIVTAQKREERLIDVPISIVALSADELQKREISGIDDLAGAVPGLSVVSSGGYSRTIALRGVSNAFGSSPLIGIYLDEASVTSNTYTQPDIRTYDLERVEVLRGPQGTLYGEGSAGGTIRFITKDPELDHFRMKADVAALFTEDGAPSQRIEEVVNVPVIENELGFRIAGTFDHEGGWINQPAAGVKDFNSQNLSDVRIKGLWKPSSPLKVDAMAVIHRNDTSRNSGEDANGNYTQAFNLTTTPRVQDDYDLYNLTLTYDLPSVRVLSASSYLNQDKDASHLGYHYPPQPGTSTDTELYDSALPIHFDSFTEEFRLTSNDSGPLQWTAGGFYRDAKFRSDEISNYGAVILPGAPLPNTTQYSVRSVSKSRAVFGDVSYKLTDRLTLGSGLRYFQDNQEGGVGCCALGGAIQTQAATFHTLNPRVYAQYKLTDQLNTYASAAKGFRSGGFNGLSQPLYNPESVWTYELGTKMSLAGGRLTVDTAIFYSNYTDYQIVGFLPPPAPQVVITTNAGDVRIKGIELGLTLRPLDQWTLSFNGDYVDSYFYEVNALGTSHVVGDAPDFFPKYTYTVSAQRDFKWNGKSAFARLDYNKLGRSTFLVRSLGRFSESDIINMLNFNMSLQWTDSLSLGVFAENLLNDRGLIDADSIEGFASRSRPRTIGVQFGVKFD